MLPDAIARPQIDLEAGLMEAITRAVHHLHTHPEASLTRPAEVIRSVTPLPDRLQLHVHPVAVAPLLYETLPFAFQETVSGIEGLRIRSHRRSTELFLVDAPDARVELVGVGRAARCAAEAYQAVRNRDTDSGVSLADVTPDRLSREETLSLESSGRAFGPVGLASGLLRRIGVLCQTLWIQTWPTGCTHFNVEWPGDTPRRPQVGLAPADPVFGIRGATIGTAPDLTFPNTHLGCSHGDPCATQHLRFRFTDLPSEDSSSHTALAGFKAGARPAWDAWRETFGDSSGEA
ncbi:hypothetical protein AMETH_3910 [Amycolatopsis methanolica 239]|uniref:Uncharacterized protein n=1 Tax=Amycolatopsis methanolica 239 TaxID=1068978 RepID=A0A076N210_AMYME|nr:hypothetical protein AMETH_3910 [Amycolatopsis methanolica 239]